MRKINLGPDHPLAKCLLDCVQEYMEPIVGPDEKVVEIRVRTRPFKLSVVMDHGTRLTVEDLGNPSAN